MISTELYAWILGIDPETLENPVHGKRRHRNVYECSSEGEEK
jgi:hypothetical protein